VVASVLKYRVLEGGVFEDGSTAEIERGKVAGMTTEPDVPVNVSDPLNTGVVDSAESVTTCGVPTAKDRLGGDAETPVGSPDICTPTWEENPFKGVAETETFMELPGASATLVGLKPRVKEGLGGGGGGGVADPDPFPPHAAIAVRARAAQSCKNGWTDPFSMRSRLAICFLRVAVMRNSRRGVFHNLPQLSINSMEHLRQ